MHCGYKRETAADRRSVHFVEASTFLSSTSTQPSAPQHISRGRSKIAGGTKDNSRVVRVCCAVNLIPQFANLFSVHPILHIHKCIPVD